MEVLLIQDVDNLGYAGEVKKVANGFGRNYLLPQKLAVLATPGALKQADTIRKTAEKHRARETEDAKAIANQLANLELLFERRAGETGKLYGSVTSTEIAEAIKEKTEIEIDKRKVGLPEPIRALGEQEVPIKLMIDVETTITVYVLPHGGILERERLSEAEAEQLEAEAEARMSGAKAAAEEQTTEPSAEEQAAEPPAEEQAVEPPAEEQAVEPPAEEQAAEPPTEKQAVEPPAEEQATEPPAEEQATEPPAEEQAVEPPEKEQAE